MNFDYNVTPEMIREKYDEMYEYVRKLKIQGVQEADDGFFDLSRELIHLLVPYFDAPIHRLQENHLLGIRNASEILACMRIAYELTRNSLLSIPDKGEQIVKTADQIYDGLIEEFTSVVTLTE